MRRRLQLSCALVLLAAGWGWAADGPAKASGKMFTLPLRDNQGRVRSLVEGDSVRAADGLVILQLGGLKITKFRSNNVPEFLALAPDCTFDTRQQVARSAGPFSGRAVDGSLALSGRGFEFSGSNSAMRVSNEVQTLLRSLTNAPGITNELSVAITSRSLDLSLEAKRARFDGSVLADEARFALAADTLTVRLGEEQGTFESIEAERNVVVTNRMDGSRTTAGRAIYHRTNDMIDLFGNPVWSQGQREARADTISFHRTNRNLRADGNVVLKTPREFLARGGFLPDVLLNPTNRPPGTNLVELTASQLRSGSNSTVARGNVRIRDGEGRFASGELFIQQATPPSRDDTARAEGGVVVEHGRQRVSAERATYSRLTDTLEFIGKPEWKLERMEGRAQTLTLWPQTNAVMASGGAHIKLIPGEAGASLLPAFPSLLPAAAENVANRTSRPVGPVEVLAETVAFTNRQVSFAGRVRARELGTGGAEPRLSCPSMVIVFAAHTNRAQSAAAQGGVVLEQGLAGGTNYQRLDARELNARMDPDTGAVIEMAAEGDAMYRSGKLFAAAERMTYDGASDTLKLLGEPFLINDDAMIYEAKAIIVNRRTGIYTLEGAFKSIGFVKKPEPAATTPANPSP